jgi:hypothetical protein
MDAHPPNKEDKLKKIKLSTILLGEIFVAVVIMSWFIFIMFLEQDEYNRIEIEEFPITYQSMVENDNAKLSRKENEKEIALREIEEKLSEIRQIEDKKGWYLSYKDLIKSHSDVIDPPETVYENYTEEEIYLIQRCVETECHGGDFDSKCNVASVIFNRINSDEFGNTPHNVITQPNQFAYGRRNISEETKLAVEYVFDIGDTTNGCIAFHSNAKRNKFNNWDYAFTDELGHNFYY